MRGDYTRIFIALTMIAVTSRCSSPITHRPTSHGQSAGQGSFQFEQASTSDTLAPRDFTITISPASSRNQNCLYLEMNGSPEVDGGCDRDAPGSISDAGSTRQTKAQLRVSSTDFNLLKLRMSSKPVGGPKAAVFDTDLSRYVAELDYHIVSRTDHSIDLWISDGHDTDYHDFHVSITSPDDVKFGIDYLAGTSCSDTTSVGPRPSYMYLSPSPLTNLAVGGNAAAITFAGVATDASNPNPLVTVDVYLPERGIVLNHRDLYAADFKSTDPTSFAIPFVSYGYKAVQIRACAYGSTPLKVVDASLKFNSDVPYTFFPGGAGARPLDLNPDLSGRGIVKVDLGNAPTKKQSLTGIMRGLSGSPSPDLAAGASVPSVSQVAEMIKPLKPGIWRSFYGKGSVKSKTDTAFDYAVGSGVPVVANMSVLWGGLDQNSGVWNAGDAPFTKTGLPKWTNMVSQFVGDHYKEIKYFDVWNEPENFWSNQNTPQQLFQTYVTAAQALTSALPAKAAPIKLSGPSLNVYNREYIRAMLDYAKSKGVEVNVISWHELQSAPDSLSIIAAEIADAREQFFNKPEYAALKIQEIHINESLNGDVVQYPGEAIGTLYFMDKGGADRAAKDCWVNSFQEDRCNDGSIDGFFVPPNSHNKPETWYKPRSVYWAQKNYADMLDQRIPCSA